MLFPLILTVSRRNSALFNVKDICVKQILHMLVLIWAERLLIDNLEGLFLNVRR